MGRRRKNIVVNDTLNEKEKEIVDIDINDLENISNNNYLNIKNKAQEKKVKTITLTLHKKTPIRKFPTIEPKHIINYLQAGDTIEIECKTNSKIYGDFYRLKYGNYIFALDLPIKSIHI